MHSQKCEFVTVTTSPHYWPPFLSVNRSVSNMKPLFLTVAVNHHTAAVHYWSRLLIHHFSIVLPQSLLFQYITTTRDVISKWIPSLFSIIQPLSSLTYFLICLEPSFHPSFTSFTNVSLTLLRRLPISPRSPGTLPASSRTCRSVCDLMTRSEASRPAIWALVMA